VALSENYEIMAISTDKNTKLTLGNIATVVLTFGYPFSNVYILALIEGKIYKLAKGV
jgi:hypothetical protein